MAKERQLRMRCKEREWDNVLVKYFQDWLTKDDALWLYDVCYIDPEVILYEKYEDV